MARFHGRVGFGISTETAPGVWSDVMVEHVFYGDIVQNRRMLVQGEKLNKDLSVGNSISIVGDAYAREHFFAIKYVEWAGQLWTVADVTYERPRLTLQLGEVYNGPTPAGPPDAP
jgi:hypothetical protein